MTRDKVLVGLILTGAVMLGQGCDRDSGKETVGGGSGEVVAKVGDVAITLEEFEKQIGRQNPLIRSRFKSLDQKTRLLDNLVEREAMVQEAKRLGLDEDPDVVQGLKKILARQLVNVEFNQKRVKEIEISDEEIEKYYQENSARYHAPEKVRIHQIFFAAAASDSKARKAASHKARETLKKLKADPKDRRIFLKLARELSDDEITKKVGGDTNFRTRAQLEEAYGKAFADAAFALKQANDLSDVVQTDKGLYLLRLSGKQAAIDLPLEKVKGQIRTTLFARARGDAYKAFVEEVKQKVGVEVFAEIVEKAEVDLSEVPPRRPGPRPQGMSPGIPGRNRPPIQLKPRPPESRPSGKVIVPPDRLRQKQKAPPQPASP